MNKLIYQITIVILISILMLSYCNKPTNTNKLNVTTEDVQIINYKDSIIFRDSIIFTHVSIKDSISKMNKTTLDKHYDKQMGTINTNTADYRDTLIDNLVFEIEQSDTLIEDLTKTIEYRDTVIHNLEIINHNFEEMLEDAQTELIKSEKKIKRKNIWIIISTSIATIATLIAIS